MQSLIRTAGILLLVSAAAVTAAPQTNDKVNENVSNDCTGEINFPHSRPKLDGVGIDPSTNSIYVANGPWYGYDGGLGGGGKCTGDEVGTFPLGCGNVNAGQNEKTGRVRCVHQQN